MLKIRREYRIAYIISTLKCCGFIEMFYWHSEIFFHVPVNQKRGLLKIFQLLHCRYPNRILETKCWTLFGCERVYFSTPWLSYNVPSEECWVMWRPNNCHYFGSKFYNLKIISHPPNEDAWYEVKEERFWVSWGFER